MIPEIGVMVGVYIVARMLEMMVSMNEKRGNQLGSFASGAVNVFGAVTVIVALLVMFDLVSGASRAAGALHDMTSFPGL